MPLAACHALYSVRSRILAAIACLLAASLTASAQNLYVQDSPSSATSMDRYVQRYDATTGAFLGTLGEDAPSHYPLGLAFGPEGNLYVGQASQSTGIQRFDVSTGKYIDTFVQPSTQLNSGVETMVFRNGMIYACLFGGLYTWEQKGSVKRFDAATGAYLDTFVQPGSGGLANAGGMVFGPDGTLYVGNVNGNASGAILRYSGSTGEFLGAMAGDPGGSIYTMDFGPDGNLYAATRLGVKSFSGTTHQYIGQFTVGGPAGADLGLVFGPGNDLYVSREGVGILQFDGLTGAYRKTLVPVDPLRLGRPFHMVFGPSATVPEPGSGALVLFGAIPLITLRRTRRRL